MAITGKFLADFSDFHMEVQKAEVRFRAFQTSGKDAADQLTKTATAFSGKQIINDATLAATAIDRLGGASKLTSSEQARVNATVSEAIEKYRALGQSAPESLQKLADATRRVDDATRAVPKGVDSIGSSMSKMAGALGIGFSVGAVVNFGQRVFDTASEIHDMSEALGVSVEAVQRYKFAAEQSGGTLEDVSRAINFMNRALAEPTDGTVAALTAAGLSFQQISQMNPEEAFQAITEGIRGIVDPAIQAKVQTELFSKSALALAPGIREGFVGIGQAATVMSTDTINSLEAAQDAWGKLADRVTVVSGTLISTAINTASSVTSSWKSFVLFADTAIKQGIGAAVALTDAEAQAAKSSEKSRDINLTLPAPIRKTKEEIAAQEAALRKAKEAAEAHTRAIQGLRDSLSGQGAIKAARDMLEAIRDTIPIQQMTKEAQENINKTMDAAIVVYQAQGKVAPQAMRDLWMATQPAMEVVTGLGQAFNNLGDSIKIDIPAIHEWTIAIKDGISEMPGLKTAIDIPKAQKGIFASLFGDPKDFGQQLAGAIQGAIQGGGNVAAAAAGAVGARIGTNVSESLTKEGGALFNKALGGIFAGALPVIGSLLGPLTSAIWNKLFGSAGRDAVKQFASSFGGFDPLHEQLNALGTAGEELWIKLTQGVGKNNPEQAKAVIDEITKALEAQKAKSAEAGDAAAAQAGTVTDANQKALDAIKGMNDEMQGLFDSIKDEAPEEVMGTVERQTRERIASIQKERDEAQKAMDDTTSHAADAAKEAGDQIDAALKARQFVIRVRAEVEGVDGLGGGIRGGPTPQIFHEAAGGDFLVNRPTLFLAGEAGTERATFSGGGRTGRDDGGYLPVAVSIDGDVLLETFVRVAKRKGWAT